MKPVSAHLNRKADCIQQMEKIDAGQLTRVTPVSFDVVSLHTNVDT